MGPLLFPYAGGGVSNRQNQADRKLESDSGDQGTTFINASQNPNPIPSTDEPPLMHLIGLSGIPTLV